MGKTMKRAKLTPWYPPEIKPCSDVEHQGTYERDYTLTELNNATVRIVERDYFDGERWLFNKDEIPCTFQHLPWRGLAEKP